jgi:hypothetical protein
MLDSLILAPAMLRIAPITRPFLAEPQSRNEVDEATQQRTRPVARSFVRSGNRWRCVAARAAWTIWAIDAFRQ